MAKKVKETPTPIYDALKPLIVAAVSATKFVTGPFGWLGKLITSPILDGLIKPLFQWYQRNKKIRADKKEGKEYAKKLSESKTFIDYLKQLNSRK